MISSFNWEGACWFMTCSFQRNFKYKPPCQRSLPCSHISPATTCSEVKYTQTTYITTHAPIGNTETDGKLIANFNFQCSRWGDVLTVVILLWVLISPKLRWCAWWCCSWCHNPPPRRALVSSTSHWAAQGWRYPSLFGTPADGFGAYQLGVVTLQWS